MRERERFRCTRLISEEGPANIRRSLLGDKNVYAPDRTFDTLHVRLELKIDFSRRTVSGVCATTVSALTDKVKELVFNAAGMRILGARGFGQKLNCRHKDGKVTVRLPKALSFGQQARVEIRYQVTRPKTGLHFVGPGPENRRNTLQLWSQGQPEDAHYWFPCHDSPHEKATSEVLVTVPKGFFVVSNGILASRTKSASSETFHWRMQHPHALYLISVAAGRFVEIKDKWRDVDIAYYCEKGREADARRGFSATIPSMDFFSEYFGVRYPYEKYAQVAAAEFPGGMENTTCTTQTDACLLSKQASLDSDLDLLVSHELAHHWFGNLVTCRDWSHAWLNEGFATYCEMLFTEHDKGRDEADYELETNRRSYFSEDAERYRRPIVCKTYKYPWVLFDRHLYEKGGWVLHMLRYILGERNWRKSIKNYLLKFRNKSVETSDLIVSIEASTGLNTRSFFDQWVFQSGYPCYKVKYRWIAKTRTAELSIYQTQHVDEKTPLFKMPVNLRFTGSGWVKNFTKTVDKKKHVFRFKLPGEPKFAEFDPEHWILKKITFDKPYTMWRHQLSGARTGLSRIQAAKSLARWGDEEAVSALASTVVKDRFWGTAAEAARALGTIRSDSAFRALKRLLKAPHPKVRRAVVEALGSFPGPETVKLLSPKLTRDASLHVQAEAARSLGRMRDPKLIGRLKRGLKRVSYWDILSAGAIGGLAATKDKSVLPVLRKASRPPTSYPLRAHAISALGRFADRSEGVVDWICEALDSQDERILLRAIHTLGSTGDMRAIGRLEGLQKKHPDTRVKSYINEALARIRGESK